jgi:hypothetical protein
MTKTKAKARPHAANIPPTPKDPGQNGLVASTSKAPKTADLFDPHSVKSAFLRRQNAPRASHPALPGVDTAPKAATPFFKSP